MRRAILVLAVLIATAAGGETPGRFDHYILALSWHPTWCAAEGDARDAPECDRGSRRGFSVHGLWPNHVQGWPEFCTTAARDPTRRETAAMADLMSSAGLAWHQWRKHGRCTGLDGAAYLRLTREAARRIAIPEVFRRPGSAVRVDPDAVEDAFLAANPDLTPEALVVTCRDGRLHEVRVCLDRALKPRACTDQTAQACHADRVALPPVR